MRQFRARRKTHEILADEHAGLLLRTVAVVGVVIPVKIGLGGRSEKAEEDLLAGRECIEARNDKAPRAVERKRSLADTVGGGTLHHAVVGDAQLQKPFAETAVDGTQCPPDGQKAPLLLRKVRFGAERRPEGDDPQLLGGQIGDIGLDLLDLLDVAEEHRGVDPILVDRVEIRKEHVAPEIEVVERLGMVFRIDAVELGDQTQPVARAELRDLGHQLIDGCPLGLPHRTAYPGGEGFGEEEPRTARGKEHGAIGKRLPVTGIQVCSDLFEKGFHDPETQGRLLQLLLFKAEDAAAHELLAG